jgi:magnesium-transporting ATPase (P-type)
LIASQDRTSKDMDTSKNERNGKTIFLVSTLLTAVSILVTFMVKWWRKRKVPPPVAEKSFRHIRGLDKDEVEQRKQEGIDNSLYFKSRRTRQEMWRENVLSIFNLSLLGLAIIQLLFGRPLDALISLGIMCLNIGVNIFQENFAKMRIKDLLKENEPRVTVIREGNARSIYADDMVVGDMVAFGPGDELLADGIVVDQIDLVIDESMLTGGPRRISKPKGEKIFAGSFCVSGRAVYRVEEIGRDRMITTLIEASSDSRERLTPIEKIVGRVLRGLLVVVAIFTVLLLFNYFKVELPIPVEVYNEVAGIIFSLAPAGLFFMIIVTYAASTADLAKVGALMNRARSVEAMAQVNTICFSRERVLTGMRVEIEPSKAGEGQESFSDSRIRQILGDFTRSTSRDNQFIRAIRNNFEGSPREVLDEASYLPVYGWNAITFDDPDLRGTYVLGVPAALEPYLSQESGFEDQTEESQPNQVRKLFSRVGGFFRRSDRQPSKIETETVEVEVHETNQDQDSPIPEEVDETPPDGEDTTKPHLFRRLLNRARRMAPGGNGQSQEEEAQETLPDQPIELLLAYYPDPSPLFDENRKPQFPVPLLPLCWFTLSEQVRPEAVPVIRKFFQSGIDVKIFAAERAEQTIALLRKVGLGDLALKVVTGSELSTMDQDESSQSAADNSVFLQCSPEQMNQVVKDLRVKGQYVAVVGDSVNEVPALRQANLAIVHKHSSQAAQSVADIILLENSLEVLERVLEKGQRIVNGLLDILKLYLTQVFYIAMLITAIQIVGFGFPFRGIQLTVITTLTITIPALGFTLWAHSGVLYGKSLSRSFRHFTVPAAITISLASTFAFFYFKSTTGDTEYVHLAITYTLVFIGLVIVLFLRPPIRFLAGGAPVSDDRRISLMVAVLFVLFFITVALSAAIPFLGTTLLLDWLDSAQDYLIIGIVVLVWAFLLLGIWRIWRLNNNKSEDSENGSISPSSNQ